MWCECLVHETKNHCLRLLILAKIFPNRISTLHNILWNYTEQLTAFLWFIRSIFQFPFLILPFCLNVIALRFICVHTHLIEQLISVFGFQSATHNNIEREIDREEGFTLTAKFMERICCVCFVLYFIWWIATLRQAFFSFGRFEFNKTIFHFSF